MRRAGYHVFAVAAVCIFASALLAAGPSLVVEPDQVLRGRFEQQRQLSGFETPLVSNGRFVVVGDRGVLWRTEDPLQFDLVITPSRFVQVLPGEPPVDVVPAEAATIDIFGIITGLLRGAPADEMDAAFHIVSTEVAGTSWAYALTPKSEYLTKQMEAISVAGSDFVENVEVRKPNGDRDTLSFTDHVLSDRSLTDDEAALLDIVYGSAAAP